MMTMLVLSLLFVVAALTCWVVWVDVELMRDRPGRRPVDDAEVSAWRTGIFWVPGTDRSGE